MKGICLRCKFEGDIQRHHILPKRWFHGAGDIAHLCPPCHMEIEKLIYALETRKSPVRVQLTKRMYIGILERCIYIQPPDD